jgi:ABC-type glycerol-3-phosphate transport system permease component
MDNAIHKKPLGQKLKARLKRTHWVRVTMFVVFTLYAFTMVYAMFWGLMNSFKDPLEYMLHKNAWPEKFLLGNYGEAFSLLQANGTNLLVMLFNSVWMTLAKSFVSLFFGTCAAYVFSKYKFYGKTLIYGVLIFTLMLPLYGGQASSMRLIHQLGLYDNPLYPILISASIQGSLLFVMRSYFDGISIEYAESARIDGAGHYQIMFQIMFPLAKPCIVSIMVLMLIGGWNDYATALYFLPSFPTIPTGLYIYGQTSEFNINYPVYFAGVMMSCIPALALYILMNGKIMSSMAMGGLKG